VNWAIQLRALLRDLFGSGLVAELRAEIEELKKERDYFRGAFERMQLIALNRPPPREVRPVPINAGEHVGSLTWLQQKQRRIEDNKKRAQEEIAANKAKDNPSAKAKEPQAN
jgi:hypothetical protein